MKPNSDEYIANSKLLIGHCGAGTILDTIKGGVFAIIISNEVMMNNHQHELLDGLMGLNAIAGYPNSSYCTPEHIDAAIQKVQGGKIKILDLKKDNNIFEEILDRECSGLQG